MLLPTARNLVYIQRLAARGFSAETIYQRIQERLSWDGPFPSVADIAEITGSPRETVRDAGPAGRKAGAAGPAAWRIT